MVYVGADGRVYERQPWGIRKVVDYFWGILNFIYAFFLTLIPGGGGNSRNESGRGRGSGGPGGPGPGGPRRRIGGITTIQDCSMPGGG